MYRYFFYSWEFSLFLRQTLYHIRITRNVCTIFPNLSLIVALRVSQTHTLRRKAGKYLYILICVDFRTQVETIIFYPQKYRIRGTEYSRGKSIKHL